MPAASASTSCSAGATTVNTERLWSPSAWTSTTRPPASAMAWPIASSTDRSRPSEKLGTDSSRDASLHTCLQPRGRALDPRPAAAAAGWPARNRTGPPGVNHLPGGLPGNGDAIPPFWGSAHRRRCLTLSARIEKANPLRSGHAKQEVSPRRRLGYRNRGLPHPTAFVDLRRSTSIARVELTGAEIARDRRIAPPGQAPRQRLDPHRYGERTVGSCGGQTRETEDEATVRSRRRACPHSTRNR